MRTILLRSCYRLLVALMVCATASAAVPFPTNMDLLVETVASAVDESLARIEMPDDAATAPLLVVAQSKHDANWMVEHLLANRLLTRGFSVTLDSTAAQPTSMRLSYRVLDLGVSAHSGLRGSKVSRQGRVTLALRLSDERDDVVHWQDEITRTQRDQIPKKQLAILQHDQFKFAKTELEEQTWSKFVEPVIVSTVLGGLIYLFFSNR
jgi:predicted kinase